VVVVLGVPGARPVEVVAHVEGGRWVWPAAVHGDYRRG
jgi:hypothetical protein